MVWVGKQLWELGRDTSVAIKADVQHDYTGYTLWELWESRFLFLGSGSVRTC